MRIPTEHHDVRSGSQSDSLAPPACHLPETGSGCTPSLERQPPRKKGRREAKRKKKKKSGRAHPALSLFVRGPAQSRETQRREVTNCLSCAGYLLRGSHPSALQQVRCSTPHCAPLHAQSPTTRPQAHPRSAPQASRYEVYAPQGPRQASSSLCRLRSSLRDSAPQASRYASSHQPWGGPRMDCAPQCE